jgi:hypothetical protein
MIDPAQTYSPMKLGATTTITNMGNIVLPPYTPKMPKVSGVAHGTQKVISLLTSLQIYPN